MVTDIVLLCTAFIALVIAAVSDLKTREVPDWLNYSVMFIGLGIRGIYSLATFDWMYFVYGLVGFGIFVGIAYAMFYTGQWGGGDAKMIMGLGALIGMPLSFERVPLLAVFFFNVLVFGALYGIVWIAGLAVKHRKEVMNEFIKEIRKRKVRILRWALSGLCLALLAILLIIANDSMMRVWYALVILVLYLLFYLFIFARAVEKATMFIYVKPEKLTEGDWIARDYYDNRKLVCGPKSLGVDKKQIEQLIAMKRKGRINKVRIKQGIPFVPSFLIAYIITLMFGAWWMLLL